jgi:hypothetical protein
MKITSTLLAVLLLAQAMVCAQPTLTSASRIKAGDWYRTQAAQSSGVAVGDTGANRVWNYSGLIMDTGSVSIDSFALPGNFAVPAVMGSIQLMSHGFYSYGTGTDTNYSFFTISSDTLRYKGYLSPDNNNTFHHQKPIIILPYFPYTYGSTCADSSLGFYNSPNAPFFDTVFTTFTYKVTGYGTLLLPGNRTFNNVLQVSRKMLQTSSFSNINSEYVFYMTPGNPLPLLEILLFDNMIESVQYMTSYYAGPVGPTYTFTGSGNWNNPANWQGGLIPPAGITPGSSIVISHPPGGSCIVNVPVTIPPGVQFIVSAGANLILPGNLTIQ